VHELGIAQELLAAVLSEAGRHGARRVEEVRLRIGTLRAVIPENLSFLFGEVSRGTIAEGAALRIEEEPVAWRCPACGASGSAASLTLECPSCGAGGPALSGGEALEIAAIDIEN
jgi:hydrogenase nickel incorporation protein HypA/HybF